MELRLERPSEDPIIEGMLDESFGLQRFSKTVYRLREGVAPVVELCLVAADPYGEIRGSIRYWPVTIGNSLEPALLLGPVVVDEAFREHGLGGQLIRQSLAMAQEMGHSRVILVGDAPYYNRFGFTRENTLQLDLPGDYDHDRFLGLELQPGAFEGVEGMVGPVLCPLPTPAVAQRTSSVFSQQLQA